MKKARRWLLITASLLMLVTDSTAVAPFKKVSIATSTTTTSTTTTSTTEPSSNEVKSDNSTAGTTKNPKLTGIPQIDYIWDPNLPRELRGYNLSSYPFFSTVPPEEDIHFKCDGLHDGFYAAIEFKCQVYHHCVYGIRHDFLCANFTAFDQRTFICHFVSDVDCEGSKNYWNRNDDLYMATTTTSTTTTTTEPPPTQRRRIVRPLRPLRRPVNRRPIDDYYYDEEEYEDEYYEERLNRRRKQRPKHRKPMSDYEDEYSDDKPRRHNTRDRFRDDDEPDEDYDVDRRKYDRPNMRSKPTDKRKSSGRKPTPVAARPVADERRSFSDDRPVVGRKEKLKPIPDDPSDIVDTQPRRLGGRRRINVRRPSPTPADIDDLDDYEKPQAHAPDQEEAAEEEAPPKVKTTPKPLEEFITPKAANSASVYARPRAPPRIARPVPVNEKKKFQYPVQKTATTASPDISHVSEDDYYDDEEYEDLRGQREHTRRRIVDSSKSDDDESSLPARRRNHNETPLAKKPSRTTIRRPTTAKKHIPAEEDDYESTSSASNERLDSRTSSRRRPFLSRNRGAGSIGRGADDVDFIDDDYDERPLRPMHRLRPKASARKGSKKPRLPIAIEPEEDDYSYEQEAERLRNRPNANSNRPRTGGNLRLRQSTPATAITSDVDSDVEDEPTVMPLSANKPTANIATSGRAASVRVVKRPFLSSRGSGPHSPRGLQPAGLVVKHSSTYTTDSTPIDMGSTISGVRLLEHGAPILRDSGTAIPVHAHGLAVASIAVEASAAAISTSKYERKHEHEHEHERERERERDAPLQGPRSTLPPRSAIPVSQARPEPQPKITLDELYENDYDVTLNDALNPTLKPLSPHPNHHHHNSAYANVYASETGVSTFVNNNKSPTFSHNNNNNNKSNLFQLTQQTQQQQQNHQNAYQSKMQALSQLQLQEHSVPPQSPSQTQSQSLPLSLSLPLSINLPQFQSQSQSKSLSQIHRQPEQLLPSRQQQQQHHQQTSQLQSQSQSQYHNHHQQQPQPHANNDYNSDDSYFSSTDIRRRAILAAPHPYSSRTDYRGVGMRIAQHFYDDLEY